MSPIFPPLEPERHLQSSAVQPMEAVNEETGTTGAVARTAAMDNEIVAASSGAVVDVATGGNEEGEDDGEANPASVPRWSCHICATSYTTPALYMVHLRKIHKDDALPVQSFDLPGISLVRCGYSR